MGWHSRRNTDRESCEHNPLELAAPGSAAWSAGSCAWSASALRGNGDRERIYGLDAKMVAKYPYKEKSASVGAVSPRIQNGSSLSPVWWPSVHAEVA